MSSASGDLWAKEAVAVDRRPPRRLSVGLQFGPAPAARPKPQDHVLSWVKQCLEVGTAAKGPQGQLDVSRRREAGGREFFNHPLQHHDQ